jgi:signal peptidase II
VDFLDFKFYGFLGLARWPTFNLADMTVVLAGILLFVTFLIPARPAEEKK